MFVWGPGAISSNAFKRIFNRCIERCSKPGAVLSVLRHDHCDQLRVTLSVHLNDLRLLACHQLYTSENRCNQCHISQYQSSPAYTGANALWIKGATAWTQYAVVPQGATVSLFAISPTGGSGSLTSDGQTYSNNYVFYPNSLLTFYAGTIGRHTLSFAINGLSSNQVVIDVVGGTYTQPNNNPVYTQPTNYPGYYPENYPGYSQEPWDYYPWNYYPSCQQQCGAQCCSAGQTCVNGNCETPSCPDGQQQCDGQCCPAGQICVNGNCETPPAENNYGGYSGSGVTSTKPVNVPSTSPVVTTPATQPSENGGAGGNSGGNSGGI